MNTKRDQSRQAAINSRKEATEKAIQRVKGRVTDIEESAFRTAVLEGVRRYRALFTTESALAEHVGVTQTWVSKVVSKGTQDPRLEQVGKVMDAIGATVSFPWSPKNDTKKISLSGSNVSAQDFRAVNRFDVHEGAVRMSDEAVAILPTVTLETLSPSLSLGGFVLVPDMRMPKPFATGDSVIIDFTTKPSEGMDGSLHMVRLLDGSVCIASAWEGKYLIDLAAKDALCQGKDYDDFQAASLGKVVMHLRSAL